jgi:hypothetical protein
VLKTFTLFFNILGLLQKVIQIEMSSKR